MPILALQTVMDVLEDKQGVISRNGYFDRIHGECIPIGVMIAPNAGRREGVVTLKAPASLPRGT